MGECIIETIMDPSNVYSSYESSGFTRRCAEGRLVPLQSSRWKNAIMCSGQTFHNATQFKDALYLMSLAGRFKYTFKRNCPKHISVICKVEGCPWKITCRSVGDSDVVRVHTFHDVHKHSIQDIAFLQPDLKAKHAAAIIDNVIQSTPDYQPRQICKDFLREHGMQLSYKQAWKLKEKAKDRIFGEAEHYYKLLPWMCEKICNKNLITYIQFTNSDEGRFKQLFVAHGFSIHGFHIGCRPIIAVDSSHMSGPYGGALLTATTFDANDGMFPLAFGVVSSENYEDWHWFLNHLKQIVGDRDVVIISDRHHALLQAVPKFFGKENHAYCYRHLKENFSSFFTKHNCKGQLGKRNALQFLNSIAYARLEHDYNIALNDLRRFSPDLATWVENNNPEHWAMSKFPKKRWDKMDTNLAESINAWLKFERHHSICTFITEHMLKMTTLLTKHREDVKKWNGLIGPRIEAMLNDNILKGASYPVYPFFEGNFGVYCGDALLNVNMLKQTCTCKEWDMLGIPCGHACAVIRFTQQNPVNFVDDWYTAMKQDMIFSGSFVCVETHDKPSIDGDVVRDVHGEILFSLKPPKVKRHPGRPKKKRHESQFQDKRQIFCSRYQKAGHNRKTQQSN